MMISDRDLSLTLGVFLALIIIIVLSMVLDSVITPYKSNSLTEYKKYVNSTLSDQAFIEELVNQNLVQRQMINELEEELGNREIIIDYLMNRLNRSFMIETSPFSRIRKEDIKIYNDRIIIYVNKAFGAGFTESTSMFPFIHEDVFALEVKPKSQGELRVGDVIGFESKVFNTTIIHRIVSIGEDEEGWYAITKGDNNPAPDPGKVRFEDIHGVLVGLIY